MDRQEYLEYCARRQLCGGRLGGTGAHACTRSGSIAPDGTDNHGYHEPEELRRLFSELIGKPVDETFGLFPPFYTECGKNIFLGRNVFINMG